MLQKQTNASRSIIEHIVNHERTNKFEFEDIEAYEFNDVEGCKLTVAGYPGRIEINDGSVPAKDSLYKHSGPITGVI